MKEFWGIWITQTGPFCNKDRPPYLLPGALKALFMITFTPDREFLTLGLFIPNGDLISPIIIVQTPGSLTGTTDDSFSQRVRNLKKYMVKVSRLRVRKLRRRDEMILFFACVSKDVQAPMTSLRTR